MIKKSCELSDLVHYMMECEATMVIRHLLFKYEFAMEMNASLAEVFSLIL